MSDYGYAVEVAEGYDEAIISTRLALRGEGFSILTEMHVGGLLGDERDGRRYLIMGAWSPATTTAQLDSDLRVAMHLPCNVVIQETSAGVLVAALDPAEEAEGSAEFPEEIALAARDAIGRVLERVSLGR